MIAGKYVVWLVIGLIVLGGGGYVAATQLPRGYRNKNPGNIRAGSVKWQGEIGKDDKGFAIFDTDQNGLRALAKLLLNYEKKGYRTVRDIISRYAPSNENNTEAYINSVASSLNVDPDGLVMIAPRLRELLPAIVKHENGFNKYSADEISDAIRAV